MLKQGILERVNNLHYMFYNNIEKVGDDKR